MSDATITYTETGSKGRYAATLPGVAEAAELTISRASPSLVIADHTLVPETLRGQGLAGLLAARLVADARAQGFRVMPLCPFVRSYAEKHRAETTDVFNL